MKNQTNLNLRNQAKFSINEIIPVIEKRITEILRLPYAIYPIVEEFDDCNYVILKYIAFPKDSIKELENHFSINNHDFVYKITDKKHATLHEINVNEKFNYLNCNYIQTLIDGNLAFPIMEKEVSKKELILTLISDFKEKYYLFESLFNYDEDLSFLDNTIIEFAKEKVKQK